MSDVRAVIIGVSIFLFVHILTWFQLNGQFFSEWFKNNNFILKLARKGTIANYLIEEWIKRSE